MVYLEALDVEVLRAAIQGFPKPKDPANLQGDEVHYEKWNAKTRNTLFRGLYKDIFNRVRNHKDAHALRSDICVLHEGTKSEREERYHLVMKKLNSFEMLPSESAIEMYSRLNVLVEEVNGLGLTQMQPSDVVRKILSVLPIDKYGHIVTVLHQGNLSTATPTQILGKIMHMRCICTSFHKMALLPPRRKIWHSSLAKRRGAKQKLIMIAVGGTTPHTHGRPHGLCP